MEQALQPHDPPVPAELAGQQTHGWTVEQWLRVDARRIQAVTRFAVEWWMRLAWRQRHIGAEHVPASGGVLACPNHTHWIDGWTQGLAHRRILRFMGKSELLDLPVIGAYLRRAGVFPVARGSGDAVAIDLARLLLQDGQFVIVYPEGTRCRTRGGGMGRPRRGAARLALATGCQVLPIATWGLQAGTGREHLPAWLRWLPFTRRVVTVYGSPFSVPPESDPTPERVAEVRDEIWSRIAAAYDQARSVRIR